MKKLRNYFRMLRLAWGYRLMAKGERHILCVVESLYKDGFHKEALTLLVGHHSLIASSHQALLNDILGPIEAKKAEQGKVSMQGAVEVTDWTETPSSKKIAGDGMPALMRNDQLERGH